MLERDGRCAYANAAFEQLSGYTFPELAAMETVLDLVVEYEDEDARAAEPSRGSTKGWSRPALPLTLRRRDGELVDLEVGGVRLDVEGRRQLVVVVRDVTDRRRAEAERERLLARSSLLAEASELFDQSLDEHETMASVARLCVRDLAEACVILLGAPASRRRSPPPREPGARPRAAGAARGQPRAPDGDGDAQQRAASSPGARSWCRWWRAAACRACSPRASTATSDDDDRALFEDLGRRAALALDSARLYAERDHVARTLQRSLLPRELPDIPGAEIAARYLAAGAGNEVGGDFYDCFPTGASDWALVIGDVCGKGAEAAALTALARYTLRAAALHTRRPRAVLEQLNDALLRDRLDYRFCTVLYVSLTPRADRVTRVHDAGRAPAAGRDPAPSGEVETVGDAGQPAGDRRRAGAQRGARRARARRRARALHRRGHRGRPLSRAGAAHDAARGLRRRGRAAIAETVERDALAAHGGPARDDVAVVVVRATRRPGTVCPRGPRGSDSDVKLLVVTPEPVDAKLLRATLGEEVRGRRGARHLARDEPVARSRSGCRTPTRRSREAEAAQEETVERLEEEGIDAAGDTGESEPDVAIQDALATFAADRIVVFSHPDLDYREDEALGGLEDRFGVPVTHAEISR